MFKPVKGFPVGASSKKVEVEPPGRFARRLGLKTTLVVGSPKLVEIKPGAAATSRSHLPNVVVDSGTLRARSVGDLKMNRGEAQVGQASGFVEAQGSDVWVKGSAGGALAGHGSTVRLGSTEGGVGAVWSGVLRVDGDVGTASAKGDGLAVAADLGGQVNIGGSVHGRVDARRNGQVEVGGDVEGVAHAEGQQSKVAAEGRITVAEARGGGTVSAPQIFGALAEGEGSTVLGNVEMGGFEVNGGKIVGDVGSRR